MQNAQDWIGLAVVVCTAGGLVSALLWLGGRGSDVGVSQLRRAMLLLWVSILACTGGLLALRVVLGVGLLDTDRWGAAAVAVKSMGLGGCLALAAGVAWTVGWLLVALAVVSRVTRQFSCPKNHD